MRTTFSSDFIHPRGIRLVLYDAEGEFDRQFAWWNEQGIAEPELPFQNGRTDLLIGSGSKLDVQNINLLATLLVHSEYNGFWRSLGEQFKIEMGDLLDRHILTGLLAAPWVRESSAQIGDDDRFFAALQELVAYAYGESARVKQHRVLCSGHGVTFPLNRRMASWKKCSACFRNTEGCSRRMSTSSREDSLHDARTSTWIATN